jgi:hypothetical protein
MRPYKVICNNDMIDTPIAGKNTIPIDIKELLILLADDEGDNDIDIVLKSSCTDNCFIKNAIPVAVLDNTLVLRESEGCEGKFRYIDICCICTVSFKCSVLSDKLFEAHNISGK